MNTRCVLTHTPTGVMYVAFSVDGTAQIRAALDPDHSHWHLSWERRHKGTRSMWGAM